MWILMIICYFGMLTSLCLITITGLQCYFYFNIFEAGYQQFALFSTTFYMFSQTLVMFYFIGSGKTIKETIVAYNLDKNIYDDVLLSKRKLFPHITLNVLLIGTVFVIGGGVHTKSIPILAHSILFFISLIHFIYLIYLQHFYFKDTARILSHLGTLIKEK